MLVDMFSEMQRAQRWTAQGELTVINNALEQARLADRLGYDCWWTVEHHGADEFSLASTPEMFNVALALNTQRIRIGHAGVLAPFKINHPIRVAERAAFVDLISNGRLELGLARSSAVEWERFGVAREDAQPQFDELPGMLEKMWADEPFAWNSNLISIPELNVIPKPLQKFPRIWCTGMSEEGARTAGRLGLGFLGTTVMEPVEKTRKLKAAFDRARQERQQPVARENSGFGLFTFVHCAASRHEAIASRAAEAAMWYVNTSPAKLKFSRSALLDVIRAAGAGSTSWRQAHGKADAGTEDCDPEDAHPVIRLINRQYLNMPIDPEEAYETLSSIDSVIIGDPEECFLKMNKIRNSGVDRLLCLQQFGQLSHAQVCSSIQNIGEQVLPHVSSEASTYRSFSNAEL